MSVEQLFTISAAVLVLSLGIGIIISLVWHKRVFAFVFTKSFPVGVFLSAFVLLCGVYYYGEGADNVCAADLYKTLVGSFQHAMRLFVLDGDYSEVVATIGEITEETKYWSENIKIYYVNYGAFLYIAAPIATFGFVLNFFKNLFSYLRYHFFFWKPTHVFSELNEKTLALARSIKADAKPFLKPLIVFTGVSNDNGEESELVGEATDLGAVLFDNEFESLKYKICWHRKLHFYLISDDENTKMHNAAAVIEKYNYTNASLYIFSDSTMAISFLDSYTQKEKEAMKITIIRVNDIRSLIYHNLDKNGIKLFENAVPDNGIRRIKAVVVGLGRYGTETVKALLWYCQIPGYTVDITAIDQKAEANELFSEKCPSFELGKEHNKDGDAKYKLDILQATAGTKKFNDEVVNKDPTYVFICLGNDEINLKTALDIRCALKQAGKGNAYIQTVIYNSDVKKRISADVAANVFQTNYELYTIGDLEEFYSQKTVIETDLIKEGLAVHMRWAGDNPNAKKDFILSDYNFSSSVAKALHARLRKKILKLESHKEAFVMIKDYKDFPQTREEWYKYIFEQTSDVKKSHDFNAFLSNCLKVLESENAPEGKPLTSADIASLSVSEKETLTQSISDINTYNGKTFSFEQIFEAIDYAAEIEHVRWNAYMYSDGFVYNKHKATQFKMHHNLVPVNKLTLADKIKDI